MLLMQGNGPQPGEPDKYVHPTFNVPVLIFNPPPPEMHTSGTKVCDQLSLGCCSHRKRSEHCCAKWGGRVAASATKENKGSPACLHLTLPCWREGAWGDSGPGGWRPLGVCVQGPGEWCSPQQPGRRSQRLDDLCFHEARKAPAVSQREFIKAASSGRSWSSLIGFLWFSPALLPLMNCCRSFFCWVSSLYLVQVYKMPLLRLYWILHLSPRI